MKFKFSILLILILSQTAFAQVLSWSPLFATADDTITIIYDATQGNGALAGITPIYAHTGVITDRSPRPNDWRYVKTNWGENTPETQMQYMGNNKWHIRFHIRSYYGVPKEEKILKLAFVFRNTDGSIVGREADGSDIFLPIYEKALNVTLLSPTEIPLFVEKDDSFKVKAVGYFSSRLTLWIEDSLIIQVDTDTLTYIIYANEYGRKDVRIAAEDSTGAQKSISFYYVVNFPIITEPVPPGGVDGINYVNDSTVTLCLFAPNKNFVYVIGDFNNWEVEPEFYMKRTPDNSRYWLTVTDLDPQKEYIFQYFIDGILRIADPYAEKISDPWNDKFISDATYPNLIPYPEGKTTEIASIMQTMQQPFEWQITNFQRPEPEDLIIYELLIRDFIGEHDYKTLIDTLGYFKRLGINAIELMPINEFEGNESWGYNPSLYFAPDKYYGPKNDLKRFIDEAHKQGIAIIIDVVLNHAYGQCPLVRLYINNLNASPWFNESAPHTDFSWGYDFNHERQATKDFVDRFTSYWLLEYHIDGFRFDFTRGLTNKYGPSGSRDESRIAILKRIYNHIRTVDPTAYVILEHLVDDNSEMKELAEYGMMLWGNLNTAYSQSAMGWLEDSQRWSDLSWGYYKTKTRGWTKPHLVTYMESHDEPWLMYKNLRWGRSNGNYDIKDLSTALDRIKLVATFFFTIPGPKMMWQFGELGYDQELPESGHERTAPKPILWNYYNEPKRRQLYQTIAALIKLRNENEVFRSAESVVHMQVGQEQYSRRINISNDSMKATIIGNFHVITLNINPNFQKIGKWYDYFSGDSIIVTDTQALISLEPGEFNIYTDIKLETPDIATGIAQNEASLAKSFELYQNYPNPFNTSTTIRYSLSEPKPNQTVMKILNILGQEVRTLIDEKQGAGSYQILWDGLDNSGKPVSSSVYLYSIFSGKYRAIKKLILIK